jgi:Collagen triple helix repeat (20 copies)
MNRLSRAIACLLVTTSPAFATSLGSAFSYQGNLNFNNSPANGDFDFRFVLYTAATNGTALDTVTLSDQTVSAGLINESLDFTEIPFNGQALWIEVQVRASGGSTYTTLAPRQPINATPYALFALAGNQGPQGPQGDAGTQGPTGPAGSTGGAGPTGPQGPTGATGAQGSAGAQGPAGATGARGAAGFVTLPFQTNDSSATSFEIDNYYAGESGSAIRGVAENSGIDGGYGVVGVGGRAGVLGAIESGQAAVIGEALVQPGGFGTGVMGVTQSANSGDAGVLGANNGSGSLSPGVIGQSYSAAPGVYGTSQSGAGVAGSGQSSFGVQATGNAAGLSGAALDVIANHSAGIAILANATSTDATAVFANGNGAGVILKGFGPGGATEFQVDASGDVYAHGAFHPNGVDYSDQLPATTNIGPGDVVVIGADGLLHRSSHRASRKVAGVFSTQPGVVGQRDDERRTTIPVALAGMIPVKVTNENGDIQPGDLLVSSSTPGHAMRASQNPASGTVIGKAMEALRASSGEIQMLVMLR